MLRSAPLGLALAACAPLPPPVPRPPAPVAPPEPRPVSHFGTTGEERVALFNDLVSVIRDGHVFSASTWENLRPLTFEGSLTELRDAFAQAVTTADLRDALTRLGNALHDPHLSFRHEGSEDGRSTLTLPIVLRPEWKDDQATMVVVESKAPGVEAGDVIASYAGVAASDLLRTFADRSNENQWAGIALGVARWMTERTVGIGDIDDDASVAVTVKKPTGAVTRVDLRWAWGGWHGDQTDKRDDPDYDHPRCAPGLAGRLYPTYELASHGTTFCLYVSHKPGYSTSPIIRFFTFDFGGPFEAEADRDHLARALKDLRGVRGLILDLRENHGGNDPKWVLDWFAPKPYLDLATHVHVTSWVEDLTESGITNLDSGWTKAISHATAGAIISRYIGCHTDDCSDTRQKPLHRMLPVPVALIVGPRCNSACDHFARVFDENGLGPIVGEPSGAGLTVLRTDHPVVVGGKKIGTLGVGLSLDYNPLTSTPVEGVPIHIDVPVLWSWAKRDVYDKELVDAAIKTLGK